VSKWTTKLEQQRILLPEALKEAGYANAFLGKWHLMSIEEPDFEQRTPTSHEFDLNIGGRECGQPTGPCSFFRRSVCRTWMTGSPVIA
jgi:arylsulfatase A-like enzyme